MSYDVAHFKKDLALVLRDFDRGLCMCVCVCVCVCPGVWLLEEESGGCEIPDEFLDVRYIIYTYC